MTGKVPLGTPFFLDFFSVAAVIALLFRLPCLWCSFVNADMIRSILPPPVNDSLILVCGPPPMVKHLAGAKNKKEQGDLSGVLAHMGYAKNMVFKF